MGLGPCQGRKRYLLRNLFRSARRCFRANPAVLWQLCEYRERSCISRTTQHILTLRHPSRRMLEFGDSLPQVSPTHLSGITNTSNTPTSFSLADSSLNDPRITLSPNETIRYGLQTTGRIHEVSRCLSESQEQHGRSVVPSKFVCLLRIRSTYARGCCCSKEL